MSVLARRRSWFEIDYLLQKTSQTLSQVIRNMDHLETQVARLLSAFVYPEYMVKKSGTSEPYHDIIYNLFMPHSSGREGKILSTRIDKQTPH